MTEEQHDSPSRDVALGMVAAAEKAFAYPFDVEGILDGFTEDVVIRFGDLPEINGKADAERFLRTRFARQKDYKLRKRLRALDGDVVGNYWDGTWSDTQTGKQMQCIGTEFWTVRGGKIALWEATINIWEVGAPPSIPLT